MKEFTYTKYMDKKPQHKGHGLEQNIAEIYRDMGYWNVKTNVFYKKHVGRRIITREFDVVYNIFFEKRYAECKYHTKSNVSLAEAEEFARKLELFHINARHAEMITNQDYTIPAQLFTTEKGIKIITGKTLAELEAHRKKSASLLIMTYRGVAAYQKDGILGAINYVTPRLFPLEKQIDTYTK